MQRKATQNLTYPDVLGMLSAGARLNTEAVQAAMGIYPTKVAPGQSFEILILLQNIYDQKSEGTVAVHVPKKDSAGNPLSIFIAQEHIHVSLGPGEVGMLHIPVTPQIGTPPAEHYPVSVSLDIHKPRGKIIRDPSGGRVPGIPPMSPLRMSILRNEVGFGANQRSANTRMLNTLTGGFGVVNGAITVKTANYTPRLESLWDASKLAEDQERYGLIEARTFQISTGISRVTIYEPLINEVERRFNLVNFPLLPGEAILIAKVMTYALEDGFQIEPGFNVTESRWFQRLAAFIDDPDTMESPSRLARYLFIGTIHDAVRLGYYMIERTIQDVYKYKTERLGTPDDHLAQANRLVDALEGRLPLNLSLVYMPLMLAGLMLHSSVRIPIENLWDTLEAAKQAWQTRRTSGMVQPAIVPKWFDQFAATAEEFLLRTRVPR